MTSRKIYTATNPQRILDKARECRYFLSEMSEHERAGDTDKFIFSLSAFLKSFRSIAYRLYGITENQSDRDQMKALEKQLNDHPQIGFLIDRANLEVHGDGAVIWKRFNISVSDDMQQKYPPRLQSRFGGPTRWMPRFRSRFEPVTVPTQTVAGSDWQFAGNSGGLLDLCRNGLDEIEELVKKSSFFVQHP
jgi:hypothetical protein